jgi:predicted tellurium resistance membrane protein TerC
MKEGNSMTMNDKVIGLIRTGVPALIGAALAWLIAQIPVVNDIIVSIDAVFAGAGADFGVTVLGLLQALSIAAVISGYYWLARTLGARFPWLEKWLLGQSVIPSYLGAGSGVVGSGDGFRDSSGS